MFSQKKISPKTKLIFFVGSLFIAVIGIAWLFQTPSPEEAFGDTGKFWDLLRATCGGWTPTFMLGHSATIYQVAIIDLFAHYLFVPFQCHSLQAVFAA